MTTTSAQQLDLTSYPVEKHYRSVRAAFDDLEPGAELIFKVSESPRAILKQFIEDSWGQFDWAPLTGEENEWCVVMQRRAATGPTSISEFMSSDHTRCDALFADAESAALDKDLARAAAKFASYEMGMYRHFEMEEHGFFPEFDVRMGLQDQGPTAVMREEHQQIRGLLSRMRSDIDDGDLDAFVATGETLVILMEQHNMKEEQMLYEMADEIFGAEIDPLLKKLVLF